MNNKISTVGLPMDEAEREQANKNLVEHLQDTLNDGRQDLRGLRRKLSATYVVIVILSIIMFFMGIVLLSVPVMAAFDGRINELQSLIAAGFGLADLAALFLFRPLDRIHNLMGDISQLTIAVNSFQTQVGLRLLEMNKDDRKMIGQAAENINTAARNSIMTIQEYFEAKAAATP